MRTIQAATAAMACILASSTAFAAATYPNLLGKAEEEGNFKTFVKAVKAAGLAETLSGANKWTIFAPTDEAFAKLPAGTLERLMKPENKEELAALLKKHVIPGQIFGSSWANETAEVKTEGGTVLKIDGQNFPFRIGDATLAKLNIYASNGKIHAIDSVLTK